MNQTMLDVRRPHNVGRVNSFDGSSSSGQSASFHFQWFVSQVRVPRRGLARCLMLMFLLLLTCQAWALPSVSEDGKRIQVKRVLVEGKENILFFHASWSKTSSRYKVELEKWQSQNPDSVIHLVDIKTLKSPVAKQFKLDNVPAFQIFDKRGELEESGQQAYNTISKRLSK